MTGNRPPRLRFAPEVTVACGTSPEDLPTVRARDRRMGSFAPGPDIVDLPVEERFDTVPGPCAGRFTVLRHLRAVDDAGAEVTGTQTLHVDDTAPPTFYASPAELVVAGTAWPPDAPTASAQSRATLWRSARGRQHGLPDGPHPPGHHGTGRLWQCGHVAASARPCGLRPFAGACGGMCRPPGPELHRRGLLPNRALPLRGCPALRRGPRRQRRHRHWRPARPARNLRHLVPCALTLSPDHDDEFAPRFHGLEMRARRGE